MGRGFFLFPQIKQKGGIKMRMVNVYDGYDVIARVQYNNNLDYWNGHDWTNGGVGRHKGLTRLKNGRYVLIHGTQWQGERDYAEIITANQALQEILHAGRLELLEEPRFKELKELYEAKYANQEWEED